jgi:LCP family protein required for cell wall assembly
MKFNRSPRRKTQTRTRPPETPPAGPPNTARPNPARREPPYGPPRNDPGAIPPTLPGRPDERYPSEQPYSPQPPAGPQYPGYPPADPRYPGYPGYPGYPPPAAPGQQQPPPPPVFHPVPPPPSGRRRPQARPKPKRRLRLRPGCLFLLLLLGLLTVPLGLYFLAPIRTNLLIIGVDYIDPASESMTARTDTIMMATIQPTRPYVGIISIPRDLWVTIPGIGENRINTAHFYAEGAQPGSGPQALRETIALNFGVDLRYYVRIRFEGFREIVDAMGGVDIELSEPMAGYPAGKHHLTGRKALAFVRDRSGTDDFFRMGQGQFMIRALIKNMLNPLKWPRIPGVANAVWNSVDTNIPTWMWPRLGLALLRVGPGGIDNRIISREMTTPFTTSEGASVLLPDLPAIQALVQDVFR